MLGVFAAARPQRLIVVVPSDALRNQLAAKFESFGVLQEFGVVKETASRPVVGRVEHAFKTEASARQFAKACNVILTTAAALTTCPEPVRKALLAECSHLFVDEAHHVAARTWKQIREEFAGKHVVQFTATPYREDAKPIGGRLLYAYPLGEAQKHGLFSRINYYSVIDFENPDRAIAVKAVEQLRKDRRAKLDHVVMARVNRISRAEQILEIYKEIASDFNPVILHSSLSAKDRRAALQALRDRSTRVIVCVDMLGEGFDLASLKIAAVHDTHQSLAVTLQFVGRFARVAGSTIGDATVVVGQPDADYDENLRELYAEDSDWNKVIRNLSQRAVGEEEDASEFHRSFTGSAEEIPIANLEPKMSTVAYKTGSADWQPEKITTVFPEDILVTHPILISRADRVAWFVTKITAAVPWGDVRTVQDVKHDLYVLYWDHKRRLLYINSSNNDSLHEGLAKAVCGNDAERVTGEKVFRIMHNVNRLVPTNVGVLDIHNRSRRFSLHVGADVIEGFPLAEAKTKTKTNLFAYGYEDGSRVSLGASLKGRVWSFRAAHGLKQWVDWCDHVGAKLTDDSIDLSELMKKFIRPQVLDGRPALVPLALEWPWAVFLNTSEEVRLASGEKTWPLIDADLEITKFETTGAIPFDVVTPGGAVSYEARVTEGKVVYKGVHSDLDVVVRKNRTPLSTWLTEQGLWIRFEQNAAVTPDGFLLKIDRDLPAFDPERLTVLDWRGVDLRKESQGPNRESDSIQARVIERVEKLAKWDLVIDDDGTGEVADVVALKVEDKELKVMLVHCKYASEGKPGARVHDLYEVCGQVIKSVKWQEDARVLIRRLMHRERKRQRTGRASGIVIGTPNTFFTLREKSRLLKPRFSFAIAQPGLSRTAASQDQLQLLASTEVYVRETANAPLEVFCSE